MLLRRAVGATLMVAVAFLATDAQPASAAAASSVSAGGNHTCAVTTVGGLQCWGSNGAGQLGDGTTTDSSTPVDVTGLTGGIAAVAVGNAHTCALTMAGGVQCWGNNFFGQLGDGTELTSTTPVDVMGLTSDVASVAAGTSHTCAVSTAGGLQCWGNNSRGELGDGTTATSSTPVDVTGLTSGVAGVTMGNSSTCGLTAGGGLQCWGYNGSGQLGNGTTTNSSTPVDVTGLTSSVAAASATNFHTCAVTTAGALQCWGNNSAGQLGDGTIANRSTPVDVTGLTSGVAAVAAGGQHTCAVTTAGALQCWGINLLGQLGDGTGLSSATPVDVVGLSSSVAAVAAGLSHTCAQTTAGRLQCWGRNDSGHLGDGTTTIHTIPVDVAGLTSAVSTVAAGGSHACAQTTADALQCWGYNFSGQLADGTITNSSTPVDVVGLTSGVAAVATGLNHTCAVTTAGGVKCWGNNGASQLGDGTTTASTTPVDVTGLTSGVAAVAAGGSHTCAQTTAGGLKCWGFNWAGQLGDGTTTASTTPVDVTGLTSGVAAVATGLNHTCAVTTAGGVKCWGNNGASQLGDGTTTASTTPVDVTGLTSGVAAVAAGGSHTCAQTTAGGLKCWGSNLSGQLGDGTGVSSAAPVDVAGLNSGVAAVAAGRDHTCALTTAGGLQCWGLNGGRLGNGTTTSISTPVDVVGLTSGVAAVATGDSHTCALTTAGGLQCWGRNDFGQVGDGRPLPYEPVNVLGFAGLPPPPVPAVGTWALVTLTVLLTIEFVRTRRRMARIGASA